MSEVMHWKRHISPLRTAESWSFREWPKNCVSFLDFLIIFVNTVEKILWIFWCQITSNLLCYDIDIPVPRTPNKESFCLLGIFGSTRKLNWPTAILTLCDNDLNVIVKDNTMFLQDLSCGQANGTLKAPLWSSKIH